MASTAGSTPPTRDELEVARSDAAAQAASLAAQFESFVEASESVATDDEHDPEGHTIAFERQQVAALRDAALAQVAALDAAIARLDDGTYGVCEACGGAIGDERLAALPAARTCIRCAAGRP